MSGPLLIGIAAVGVGWAWVNRNPPVARPPSMMPPTEATASDVVSTNPAAARHDTATTDTEVRQPVLGLEAVKSAIDTESHAPNVGDIPVAGGDGGQVLPAKFDVIEGGLIIDNTKSPGGTDPSNQRTSLNDGKPADSPPAITQGDTQAAILEARYGCSGANGLTKDQIGNAYAGAAIWANEVF